MKFIIDKEINLSSENQGVKSDMLQTKHYADTLLQCLKDAPEKEPYTIGLFGEWGSGKSSVIATMIENVSSDPNLKKVKIVNYDAWKYSGDSFRRMFLYELRKAFKAKESPLMQRFYVNETDEVKIKTALNWKKVGLVIAFIVLSLIALLLLYILFGVKILIPSSVALVAFWFSLYTFLYDQLKITQQKPILFAPEQFEDCYKEIVGCAIKWDEYKEKTLKWITFGAHQEQFQRIVIVVDNIDRCQPDTAYSLLTDIKNFLCKEFNVIFVVPVDIYALRKHIIRSSSEQFGPEADEFLRKFFNTSIWMKPFQNDEMFDYANQLSLRNELGYSPDTISLVANGYATNPRRIIQLFNNLQIELSGYDTEFSKEHQTLICKLLIIREEFPKYHRLLLENPQLFYVDVVYLRNKAENERTPIEKSILNDTRLFDFLLATAGISTRYINNEDVVTRILVNTQIKNSIPENIRQAYRSADKDVLLNFVKEEKNLKLLINYLQDNIKKMSKRETIEAEGKTHLSVLLILFESGLLNTSDKKRLMAPLDSYENLQKGINLFSDKTSLIKYGHDLESISLPKLTNTIEDYFKTEDNLVDTITESDALNLFYAASIWDVERCRNIAEKFFTAFQMKPVECRNYKYDKDKYSILFSNDIHNHLLNQFNAEECTDKKSSIQSFKYLCHIEAIGQEQLLSFIKKATEKALTYDYKNKNNEAVVKYLKELSEVFYEVRYLGRSVPMLEMTSLFDKINGAHTEVTPQGYNSSISTTYSLAKECASDSAKTEVFISFFTNANIISDGPVVLNGEIEKFSEVEANRDAVLEALMYIKGQGIDVSTWTNAVLKDPRRTDVKRIEILKETMIRKAENGTYEVAEKQVKSEIVEMVNLIQIQAEGYELLVEMFNTILNDERIDRLVREILSGKTLDELKQLPESLMQRAIVSFEKNMTQLSIDKDVNIFQLIASRGSSEGMESVWSIINPILADGKNRQLKVINNAIQVLKSFSKLTVEQAEALAGNVKALPATKLSEENKEVVLNYIREHTI